MAFANWGFGSVFGSELSRPAMAGAAAECVEMEALKRELDLDRLLDDMGVPDTVASKRTRHASGTAVPPEVDARTPRSAARQPPASGAKPTPGSERGRGMLGSVPRPTRSSARKAPPAPEVHEEGEDEGCAVRERVSRVSAAFTVGLKEAAAPAAGSKEAPASMVKGAAAVMPPPSTAKHTPCSVFHSNPASAAKHSTPAFVAEAPGSALEPSGAAAALLLQAPASVARSSFGASAVIASTPTTAGVRLGAKAPAPTPNTGEPKTKVQYIYIYINDGGCCCLPSWPPKFGLLLWVGRRSWGEDR
jgi:hypothetical protein